MAKLPISAISCQELKMHARLILLFLISLITSRGWSGIWGYEGERDAYLDIVWEYRLNSFSRASYGHGVENLFYSFEEKTNKSLHPGKLRKVGIKLYTASGNGIATPTNLVKAVIDHLKRRGFKKDELFIIDLNERELRESGFIPPLSKKAKGVLFEGVPIYILDSEKYYDPLWYYESPLPAQSQLAHSAELIGGYGMEIKAGERKSFLAKPLLTEVDFWINLPVILDHQTLGISGVLTNATLGNISNRDRFHVSPANAPIAVAEIAAIPELKSGWVFSIITLERFQYMGGPVFNSLYTRSEPLLLMSVNPVILDVLMLNRINHYRNESGFNANEGALPLFTYAENLGLGIMNPKKIKWIRLP